MTHWRLDSLMLRSSPMVGSEMNTAVVFAVWGSTASGFGWEAVQSSGKILSCVSRVRTRMYSRSRSWQGSRFR